MRIYKASTGQFAEPDTDGYFVVGLKKKDNTLTKYERFLTVEAAGAWLCGNPDWGIRMNPGWSLVHRDIVIERDS